MVCIVLLVHAYVEMTGNYAKSDLRSHCKVLALFEETSIPFIKNLPALPEVQEAWFQHMCEESL